MKNIKLKEVFLPIYDRVVLTFLISFIITALVNWIIGEGEFLRYSIMIFTALLVIWCLYYLQLKNITISEGIRDDLLVDRKFRNYGIQKVYANRHDFFEDLKSDLKKSTEKKDLKIQGISLRSHFNHDFVSASPITKALHDTLMNGIAQQKLSVKALVIDPTCEQANIRKRSDLQGGEESNLEQDVKSAVSIFLYGDNGGEGHPRVPNFEERVRGSCTSECNECANCLSLKIYKASASCFMVIFEDYIGVEQYHSGGWGGEIPLIRYARNSANGKILERHFDFIWSDKTTKPVNSQYDVTWS